MSDAPKPRRKRRRAKKNVAKVPATKARRGRPVPRANGQGALLVGNPGNKGGPGRPPSAIREHLRGSFDDRIRVIEDIANGAPVQRVKFKVEDIVPHIVCGACGASKIRAKGPEREIAVLASASSRDRLSALDLAAKYGLGTKDEISVVSPDVQLRLNAQAAAFISELAPDALAIVKAIVDRVWQ